MRIEEATNVTVFTIYDAPSLDPITVVLQDFGPGNGRIIIECYGNSWAKYWGAMGEQRIGEFVSTCDFGYVVGKLAPYGKRMTKHDEAYLTRIVKAVQKALALPSNIIVTGPGAGATEAK